MDNRVNVLKKKLDSLKILPDEDWAIYGTGEGGELIYDAMQDTPFMDAVKYVIDGDEKAGSHKEFHGLPIKKLSDICYLIKGIIIAAPVSHNIIRERINNYIINNAVSLQVIDIFGYSMDAEKLEYIKYIEESALRSKTDFVEFCEEGYNRRENDTKVIAWHLPQFHQIELNNKFHGQGFTEWSNTSAAYPMFTGHYQPHIPYDVGYYDLLNIDTFKRQIFLAKHYGVYGFCFHYYWFSGKKILEKPLELFLKHKELNMPFCLNWANENWVDLWDNGNNDLIMEFTIQEDDDKQFMEDILPYMKDPRYIKIHGRPILSIYLAEILGKEKMNVLLYHFRKMAQENGFPDLYILLTTARSFEENVSEWGADALVEYSACWYPMEKYRPEGYINPYFAGEIYDVTSFVKSRKYMQKHISEIFFRSALVSWDNTARKAFSSARIYKGYTPETFKQWMKDIITESKQIHSKAEDIVFVNSWNEWAEGSHLEPDMKYGYAYLQMLKEALEETSDCGSL